MTTKLLLLTLALTTLQATAQTTVGTRTQALTPDAWEQSQWISVVDAPVVTEKASDAFLAADGANWFLSTVTNAKPVVRARWMTTALGVYQLYLNGRPVGNEVLKPGFTPYAKTKRSFTYDVTDVFQKGNGARNLLAAQVTPGWWADKIVTPGDHQGMIGKKCAFRAVLELTYADGTMQRFPTDCSHWRAAIAGPVTHAGIFDGETYDARRPMPLGKEYFSQFAAPEPNNEFSGDILPSEGAEVYLRRDLTLSPVQAYVWQGVVNASEPSPAALNNTEGAAKPYHGTVVVKRRYEPGQTITLNPGETLVVDFGQNCSAVPAFRFKAKEGTVLTCLPAEILNDGNGAESRGMDGPEGSIHRRNLRAQKTSIQLAYTFGPGNRFVSYQPQCTFFGYRYISVTATDKVTIKDVTSVPVSSIAQQLETGTLTTGNADVNKIIANTIWGQRSNYLSVPTDCPQRDERLGWMADTQVFAETGSFFANTRSFFHKWMRDVRDSQSPTGAYPGVSPTAQYGSEPTSMMRLGWADAGIIVPWTVWKQFADTDIIRESFESMDRFMQHVNDTKYNHQTLVAENGNYQWADWLSYEPLETCVNKAFDEHWKPLPDAIAYWNYLSASYWLIDAQMMADMAQAIGRDAQPYRQMADTAWQYLRDEFLNADGTFKVDILNTMQTPVLFALKNQLLDEQPRQAAIDRLRRNFADHGQCLQTGFLGTSILMQTLTDNGMTDIAYDLLFQRKNPSWLYSIDNGATTIWERWNSYRKDSGLGPNGMNSFNHYAYGCVCQWLWETAAGIAADPAQPGFRHIIMKPVPDKRLGSLTAEYPSAAGTIKSAWHYEGNEWVWDFTIPAGTTATVTLPGQSASRLYQPGTHQVRLPL